MNRHPNIAFFGGTVIIAIMVLAAFANVAKAVAVHTANSSQLKLQLKSPKKLPSTILRLKPDV